VKVINGDPRHSYHKPIITDVGKRKSSDWSQKLENIPKFGPDGWRKRIVIK
jgi:hypothetical protein